MTEEQCIICSYEISLTCSACGTITCPYCTDECANEKCQNRCCFMCHRGCQGCDTEIICGHCSHTCQTCSTSDLCTECINYSRTEDGKNQCIKCIPLESDSSDSADDPTQTSPDKRQKTEYKPPKEECE